MIDDLRLTIDERAGRFGLRWQSAAATPLSGAHKKRHGASLLAAAKVFPA